MRRKRQLRGRRSRRLHASRGRQNEHRNHRRPDSLPPARRRRRGGERAVRRSRASPDERDVAGGEGAGVPTTGITDWVYRPDDRMSVDVELGSPQQPPPPDPLEPLEFELSRYLTHVHVGPYQAVPQKGKALKAEL